MSHRVLHILYEWSTDAVLGGAIEEVAIIAGEACGRR